MTDKVVDAYHRHQAKLTDAGEAWQKKLAYGDGRGWRGDRNLVLKRHVLLDQMEVWHVLPGEKDLLIFSIAAEEFDIDLLCQKLAIAMNRSNEDVIEEVDLHNAARQAEVDKEKEDAQAEYVGKMHWAMRKDFHHEPAPITVPDHKLTNVDPT